MSYAIDILLNFWMVLSMMAPYLLLGFLVAGLLSVLVTAERVERHLGGRGVWPVVKAALWGMPIPLCSCGVIPVSASLRRHGASKGSTVSFLISTPETGVDSIAATWGLMGGVFAAFRVVVAIVSGVIGGLLVELFDRVFRRDGGASPPPPCTGSCCADTHDEQGRKPGKIRRMMEYGFVDLPQDIGKSVLVGLAVAAMFALLPQNYIQQFGLGGGILSMLAMAALGAPIYVCATASIPMALGLVHAGVTPGAALVFLIVGPATNAATIAMVWKVMGPRTAVVYLLSVMGVAITAGLSMDFFFEAFQFAAPTIDPHDHSLAMSIIQNGSAVVLLAVFAHAIWRRGRAKAATPVEFLQQSQTLHVTGMTCSHCAAAVRKALLAVPGVQAAEVDLTSNTAMVSGKDLDQAVLKAAVEAAGYRIIEDPKP